MTFTQEQLLNESFKNIEGENNLEVKNRINSFFKERIYESNIENIAIVSHGVAIKFFLQQFCNLDTDCNLLYKDKKLIINSPCVIKIIINNKKIDDIIQIFK